MLFIATVKLPRDEFHDPANKQTGRCPITLSRSRCTDRTGQHHSILVEAESLLTAQDIVQQRFSHITRIEEAREIMKKEVK